MKLPPTQRFSSRVENYVKYRPSYPRTVLELLQNTCGLSEKSVVADIGSGTGISTKLLLDSGATVYGVEPNADMRAAGDAFLAPYENFHSVDGTAEETRLPDQSVDLIVAGQAFHWFEKAKARVEFARILKPRGWVALMWNTRKSDATPFLLEFEALVARFCSEYGEASHRNVAEDALRVFFAPAEMQMAVFENEQWLDYDGLQGRLLSSSYAPEAGHPDHEPMIAELKRVFDAHQEDGLVQFRYETEVFYGHL